jgi:hypothetical protein
MKEGRKKKKEEEERLRNEQPKRKIDTHLPNEHTHDIKMIWCQKENDQVNQQKQQPSQHHHVHSVMKILFCGGGSGEGEPLGCAIHWVACIISTIMIMIMIIVMISG